MKEQITTALFYMAVLSVVWIALWFWSNYELRRPEGPEMSPTLRPGGFTLNLVRRPGDRTEDFHRNDIVAFEMDGMTSQAGREFFTARVLGLPGDRIKIVNGVVYVNGRRIPQDYVPPGAKTSENREEIIVPQGTLYVAYDRRSQQFRGPDGRGITMDSRTLGPIGVHAIVAVF